MNTVSINFDTICAISSPQGIGGISIIRISGLEAFSIAGKNIFQITRKGKRISSYLWENYRK